MASIRKRGKSWRVEVMQDGVRRSRTFDTKAQALAWSIECNEPDRRTETLADAAARFIDEVCPSRKGRRWEVVRLRKFLAEPISRRRLSDLAPADFAAWRDQRLREVKGATVTRELTLLASVFRIAVQEWGWLEQSPLKGVKKPPDSPPRDRRISDAEITAIVAATGYEGGRPSRPSHVVALAFMLAIETGMRAGEIRSLTPATVDLRRRVARLTKTKNGQARDVPLSRRAIEILESAGCHFDISAQSLDVLFRRYRDKAGIDGLTFHDSRHEAITRLASKLEVLELARMVGHKNLNQLLTYFNKTAQELASRLD